jgi:hypothetical protein
VIGRLVLVGMSVLVTACSPGPSSGGATVPHTGSTDDLAPSQITAQTVTPPDTPPRCDPGVVTVWTAQAVLGEATADAVLRVRNDGGVWCEVDVTGSRSVDPMMEPDVWLEPGAWADLVVGSSGDGCGERSVVESATVDVNGAQVDVETAAVVGCGWQLTAFHPNDVTDDSCAALDVVAVDGAVVVRNGDVMPCRLGALVSVAGEGVAAAVASEPAVAVRVLAGGDVVAFEVLEHGDGCSHRPVELLFDSGATAEVSLDGCSIEIFAGSPQPWIGGPGSPIADDPMALLLALDPF